METKNFEYHYPEEWRMTTINRILKLKARYHGIETAIKEKGVYRENKIQGCRSSRKGDKA